MTGQANSSILAGAWHKLDGVHSDISILQVVVDHIVCIWIALLGTSTPRMAFPVSPDFHNMRTPFLVDINSRTASSQLLLP